MDASLRDLECLVQRRPTEKNKSMLFEAQKREGLTKKVDDHYLLLDQYSALLDISRQIEGYYVRLEDPFVSRFGYVTTLTIVDYRTFSSLYYGKKFNRLWDRVQRLEIPKTLTQLRRLRCSSSQIEKLVIPLSQKIIVSCNEDTYVFAPEGTVDRI